MATAPTYPEIFDENASIAVGRHEPYTWVSSAYKCGNKPWLQSARSNRRCEECIAQVLVPILNTPLIRRVIDDLVSPQRMYCNRVIDREDATEND
jgi:hypothetical protein